MKYLIHLIAFLPLFALAQQSFFMTTYTAQAQTLSNTGSFITFTMTQGSGPSSGQTIQINGSGLVSNCAVSLTGTGAADMEFSISGGTYGSTGTITATAGQLSGQPVSVTLRVIASAPAATYTGNLHFASGTATLDVPWTAVVSSASQKVIQVQLWDGSTTGSKMHKTSWNIWSPRALGGGSGNDTAQSQNFTDTNGVATTVNAYFSVNIVGNTEQSFYTTNGAGYAAATTSGFPDTVFQTPYLFTGPTSGQDTLYITNLPTPSSGNFTVELISSRATTSGRTETFQVQGTTLPSTGSFTADNNLNNLTGGHVPLYWTNVAKDGSNRIVIIARYTNQFSFFNAFRITWNP